MKTKTTTELVREYMQRGQWTSPYAIQASIRVTQGRQVSDAAITARIRELRRPEYGGFKVDSRPVGKGSKSHEYKMDIPPAQMSLLAMFPDAHLETLITEEALQYL